MSRVVSRTAGLFLLTFFGLGQRGWAVSSAGETPEVKYYAGAEVGAALSLHELTLPAVLSGTTLHGKTCRLNFAEDAEGHSSLIFTTGNALVRALSLAHADDLVASLAGDVLTIREKLPGPLDQPVKMLTEFRGQFETTRIWKLHRVSGRLTAIHIKEILREDRSSRVVWQRQCVDLQMQGENPN